MLKIHEIALVYAEKIPVSVVLLNLRQLPAEGILLFKGVRGDGMKVRVKVQDVIKLELCESLATVDNKIRLVAFRNLVEYGSDLVEKTLGIQRLCYIPPGVHKIALQRKLSR